MYNIAYKSIDLGQLVERFYLVS